MSSPGVPFRHPHAMIGAECDVDALPSQGRDIGMQGIALGRADPQCLQPVFVDIAPGGGEIDRANGDIAVQQRLDALPVAVVIEVLEAHGRGVLQHQQQEASSSRENRVNKARPSDDTGNRVNGDRTFIS